MGITSLLCTLYMWWAQVEHFPLGQKDVRKLLMARGFGGFFGREYLSLYRCCREIRSKLIGDCSPRHLLYVACCSFPIPPPNVYERSHTDSLQYLPLAEATVITFLAPIVACWACSILIHEPFTRSEQIAGLVSLVGVILIARPTSFFSRDAGETPIATATGDAKPATNATTPSQLTITDHITSGQRLLAVGVALIGVLGAASAYTTVRMIGQRAHPLISVNYFAAWTTLVATAVLLFVPGMDFQLPSGVKQWSYLVFLGVCGFVMQILLTAGLSYEKSSRATNMVYTNMLFALAFDKLVFDTTMGSMSIVGSSLILGSALYLAVRQDPSKESKTGERTRGDEEVGLMSIGGEGRTDTLEARSIFSEDCRRSSLER